MCKKIHANIIVAEALNDLYIIHKHVQWDPLSSWGRNNNK